MLHFVELRQVKKLYQMGEVTISAVDGIDFQINRGEFVVIVGPSGAGKTTVLNILGGMDTCTSGEVWVDGKYIGQVRPRQLTAGRYWLCIPVLQSDPKSDSFGECGAGPADLQKSPERGGSIGGSGLRGAQIQFSGAAFRRRAAAGGHCQGFGEKSQAAALR